MKLWKYGKIVRKDLTKKIKEGANVPVYVLELDIDALPDPVVERTNDRIDKDNRIGENVIETQKAA